MVSVSAALVCVLVALVIAAVAYWLTRPPQPPPTCVSNSGVPGTCNYNKDCHYPNGVCQKDSNGACVCICAPGYSGINCQTKGVPYDSYSCMGPNKSPPNPPAKKDGQGLCVCPSPNWAAGKDGNGTYVQCLGCAGDWGPLGSPDACSMKWTSVQNMVTNNCYNMDGASDPVSACVAEYGFYDKQVGPQGVHGSVSYTPPNQCSPAGGPYASCSGCPPDGNTYGPIPCDVTGWMPPGAKPPTCSTTSTERPCSGYKCLS